jgi:urea transport system permease protein
VTVVASQLFTGISIGAVLLLIALGLALTFGQMGVINMAHGEFIMAGAYTTFVLQSAIADAGVSLLVAIPVAFAVAGAMGVLLEFLLIRRLYARPLDTLLSSSRGVFRCCCNSLRATSSARPTCRPGRPRCSPATPESRAT